MLSGTAAYADAAASARHGPDVANWRPAIQWISKERIRGSYVTFNADHYRELGSVGLNSVLSHFNVDPAKEDREALERICEAAKVARESGLRLFVGIGWLGYEAAFLQTRPYRAVHRLGVALEDAPCPSDHGYWDAVITKRMVRLARLAKEVPIAGVAVDFEPYATKYYNQAGAPGMLAVDGIGGIGRDVCFCDLCFGGFLKSKGIPLTPKDVPPDQRDKYLVEHGYITSPEGDRAGQGAYFDYLRSEWAAFARETERAVHKENPDLLMGFLPGTEDVVTRAWGKPDMPVVVFSEAGYMGGYSAQALLHYGMFKRVTGNFVYASGIIFTQFTPLPLLGHLMADAENFHGYWIFSTSFMTDDWRQARRQGSDRLMWLKATTAEYWDAIAKANAAIMQMPPQSARLNPAPPLPQDWAQTPPQVPPLRVAPATAEPAGRAAFEPGCFEQWFRVRAGEEAQVAATLSVAKNDRFGAPIALYGPNGEMEQFALLRPGETKRLAWPGVAKETYTVVVSSLSNLVTVAPEAALWSRDASRTVTTQCADETAALFYVPGTADRIRVVVTADAPAECAVGPLGQAASAAAGLLPGRETTIEVEPERRGAVWRLSFSTGAAGPALVRWRIVSPAKATASAPNTTVTASETVLWREGAGVLKEPAVLWRHKVGGEVYASITLVDLNGDGKEEILEPVRDGALRALNGAGEVLWLTDLPDVVEAPPAVGDLDGNGSLEIVCGDRFRNLHCLSANGEVKWSRQLGGEIMWASPTLVDLDGDGKLEILLGAEDGHLYCVSSEGEVRWLFVGQDSFSCAVGAGPLAPGEPPVIVAPCSDKKVYCLNGSGALLWSFETGDTNYASPLLLDLDHDGVREILFGSGDNSVYCLKKDGSLLWRFEAKGPFDSTLALADLDGDGVREIVALDHLGGVYVLREDGSLLWEQQIGMKIDGAPAIGDVDGDGQVEMVIGTRDAYLVCLSPSGEEKWRWAYGIADGQPGSCAIGDCDREGFANIYLGTKAREIVCLSLNAPFSPRLTPWPLSRPPLTRAGLLDRCRERRSLALGVRLG